MPTGMNFRYCRQFCRVILVPAGMVSEELASASAAKAWGSYFTWAGASAAHHTTTAGSASDKRRDQHDFLRLIIYILSKGTSGCGRGLEQPAFPVSRPHTTTASR